MIRILIIDGSVVARRMISSTLEEDGSFRVLGTAPDYKTGLRKINQLQPDIVLLDPYLSENEDFSGLHEMREEYPHVPIVLFTDPAQANRARIHARKLSRTHLIEKPSGGSNLQERKMLLASTLVSAIREQMASTEHHAKPPPARTVQKSHSASRIHRIDVVAIGVSTGGPAALARLMPTLPKNLPVPIVIVQHMPAHFTSKLAKRLNDASQIPIYEGAAGDELRAGAAWLAPGGYHMVVVRDINGVRLDLNLDPPEEGCRPAVDVMFRSVADVYGPNVLAVILTGMGKDGLEGSKTILKAGGRLLAQDKESSVIWGMPGAVTKAGLPEKVAPLDQLGFEIVSRVKATQSLSLANRI